MPPALSPHPAIFDGAVGVRAKLRFISPCYDQRAIDITNFTNLIEEKFLHVHKSIFLVSFCWCCKLSPWTMVILGGVPPELMKLELPSFLVHVVGS